MSSRQWLSGWKILIPASILAMWLLAVAAVGWRARGRGLPWHLSRNPPAPSLDAFERPPVRLDDPRLSTLLRAANSWWRDGDPQRLVVDQVCLVPDAPSFFEAIAVWDESHFFPILIDEPVWVLPFLRSFRPARVVRYSRRASPAVAGASPAMPEPPASRRAEWSKAFEAVAAACASPAPSSAARRSIGDVKMDHLRQRAPGVVFSSPQSPMLAGAVALAAGHAQPLLRLEPQPEAVSVDGSTRAPYRLADILTPAEAWTFAHQVENRVAAEVTRYRQLGDGCDFVTIAGDWPYRYTKDSGLRHAGDIYALDDLIGRELEGRDYPRLDEPRRRWAYTGRLLGDPAASVARAMGALFLQPGSALLWNTYGRKEPWSDYSLIPAENLLARMLPGPGAVMHQTGQRATLTAWHATIDPVNRFGLVLLNSSGGPDAFTIRGGPGRPADIPWGIPSVVSMIHSFSAQDPTDPQTIAGRWLAHGAFVYFGAMNEPFLTAFRTPQLISELLAAGVPLVAALRQGEGERFDFPWRLVYLGDPLYRIDTAALPPRRVAQKAEPGEATSSPRDNSLMSWLGAWSKRERPIRSRGNNRLSPSEWQAIAADYAQWPVTEIAPLRAGRLPLPPSAPAKAGIEDALFRWCLESAIRELTRTPAGVRPASHSVPTQVDWRSVLQRLSRDRLQASLRPVFDDLLIDALREEGAIDELQSRLARIPPAECGPRVWLAQETCAMNRLTRLAMEADPLRGFQAALDLWDDVMRLRWPAESRFPTWFTERVAALASADPPRRLAAWRGRLRQLAAYLRAQPVPFQQAAVVAAEAARVESQLARETR
jgi:hypothetical protein